MESQMTIVSMKLLISLIILHSFANGQSSNCPNIISRSQWGAKRPKELNYLIIPLQYMIIHHTVTSQCTTLSSCTSQVENIQSYHMNELGWHDIGYSFLVGGDGNVYEGVGWSKEGAHTYGYNKKSIGVAFIGSYQDKGASQVMLDAVRKLIACGISQGVLRQDVRVIGGRQVTSTASPGLALFNQIQTWAEWVSNP